MILIKRIIERFFCDSEVIAGVNRSALVDYLVFVFRSFITIRKAIRSLLLLDCFQLLSTDSSR